MVARVGYRPWQGGLLAVLLAAAGACGDGGTGGGADAGLDAPEADADAAGGEDALPDGAGEDVAGPEDGAGEDVAGPDGAAADGAGEDAAGPEDAAADGAGEDATGPEDAATDGAGPEDAATDAPGPDDASGDAAEDTAGPPPECPGGVDFDYVCDIDAPLTCPDGLCLFGLCLGPVLDEAAYAACGDGVCGDCEAADGTCPADCAAPPAVGPKQHDAFDTTFTVWVHGFSFNGGDELADKVYGSDRGCGGLLGDLAAYGIVRPCGNTPEGALAPNQLAAVEYYGGTPAPWLTAADVAEIEQHPFFGGVDGLQRYGLIVAKFIRHKLDTTGAQYVNLACHSMGCLVLRHVIENDLEGLASEGRFVRWFTSAGVIAGARLARLFDNPTVQDAAEALGIYAFDFAIMLPDWVQEVTATWDHRLHEGNNPLLAGTLIHHVRGSDPKVKSALNIQLLDLNNPDGEPNDGIMYTDDEWFWSQAPAASFVAPDGTVLPATASTVFEYHEYVPEHPGSVMQAAAALFHRRRVVVRLAELELYDDREADGLFSGEQGTPPADVGLEVDVRFAPYVPALTGKDPIAHQTRLDHRTVDLLTQAEGTTSTPGLVVYSGPVFDEMTTLALRVNVLEVDWYPHEGVVEWPFDTDELLVGYDGPVDLTDHTFEISSAYARAVLSVEVVDAY